MSLTAADPDPQIMGGRGGGVGRWGLGVRGGGHPDPEIRGRPSLQKNFYGPSSLSLV